MFESTPIVAFDQHAASVTAAVLLPGVRQPAAAPAGARRADDPSLPGEGPSAGGGAVLLRGRPLRLRAAARADGRWCVVRRDRPGADSAARRGPDQDRSSRCHRSWPCCIAPVRSRASIFPPSRKKPCATSCAAARTFAPTCFGAASAVEVPLAARPSLHRHQEGVDPRARRVAARADVAAAGAAADPGGVPARRGRSARPAGRRRDRSAGLPHARAARHAGASPPLLPRHRRSDGLDHRRRVQRSAPLSDRPQRDGLRGARPVGAFERRQARPRRHHQNRQCPSPPGRGRSGLALSPSPVRRPRPAPAAARATGRRSVSRRGRRSTGSISAIGSSPAAAKRNSMS